MTCTNLNACMVCRNCKMPTFYCGHRAENYLTSIGRLHETHGYKHLASKTIIQCMCSSPPHQFLVVLKSGLLKTYFFLIITHDVHTAELRRRTMLCPNSIYMAFLKPKMFSHFLWRPGFTFVKSQSPHYTRVELK